MFGEERIFARMDGPPHRKQLAVLGFRVGLKVWILLLLLISIGSLLAGTYPFSTDQFTIFVFISLIALFLVESPESAPIYAYLLISIGRCYALALWLSDIALRFYPNEPFSLLTKGASCLGLERYEEAESFSTLSIEAIPEISENYFYRGFARFFQGKYELAEQDFLRGRDLEAGNSRRRLATNLRMQCCRKMEDHEARMLALNSAEADVPANSNDEWGD